MSLQQISDLIAQLASDGIPEPVALLTVARRALEVASSQIATSKKRGVVHVYHALGTIAGAIVTQRDSLDELLAKRARITVQISKHASGYLQLDSTDNVTGYGLTTTQIEDTRLGGAKITGTPEQIEKLADFLNPSIIGGTDIDPAGRRAIKLDYQRLCDAVIVARKAG